MINSNVEMAGIERSISAKRRYRFGEPRIKAYANGHEFEIWPEANQIRFRMARSTPLESYVLALKWAEAVWKINPHTTLVVVEREMAVSSLLVQMGFSRRNSIMVQTGKRPFPAWAKVKGEQ